MKLTQFSLAHLFAVLTLLCVWAAITPEVIRDFCELFLLPTPSWVSK